MSVQGGTKHVFVRHITSWARLPSAGTGQPAGVITCSALSIVFAALLLIGINACRYGNNAAKTNVARADATSVHERQAADSNVAGSESSGPERSGLVLAADIMMRLRRTPLLEAVQDSIHVDVERGVATLSGRVDTWLQRHDAERIAAGTRGVVSVDNRIIVEGIFRGGPVTSRNWSGQPPCGPREDNDHSAFPLTHPPGFQRARPGARVRHEALNAILWVRTAAEYKAAALQAFRVARSRLDEALATPDWTSALEQQKESCADLPPAVILDVDQTLLDNSPFEASCVLADTSFEVETWKRWAQQAEAHPIPGALEFCQYAAERSVTVFYVTNRSGALLEAMRQNLARFGFPLDARRETVLARGKTADKSARRRSIATEYRVLLLVGDNLGDFASNMKMSPEARNRLATKYSSYWGRQWIILPNPMYGEWKDALAGGDNALTEARRLQRELEYLRE